MEDIRGDFLGFFDRGVNQAGGGNGVDLSGDACRELVDQVFGIGVKDFFRSAGGFHVEDAGKQRFVESGDAVVAFFQCFEFLGLEGGDGAFATHEVGEFLDECHEGPGPV
ncbi:MAG: hypothetical protein NG747_08285 [Candidatus Brocadia sp.]|nr:hypothetical protein [Candidatus Brocadia sp.]